MRQICYADDAQIVAVHVWKYYSDRPRVCVELRAIAEMPVEVRKAIVAAPKLEIA
jgi:hypothetical protein